MPLLRGYSFFVETLNDKFCMRLIYSRNNFHAALNCHPEIIFVSYATLNWACWRYLWNIITKYAKLFIVERNSVEIISGNVHRIWKIKARRVYSIMFSLFFLFRSEFCSEWNITFGSLSTRMGWTVVLAVLCGQSDGATSMSRYAVCIWHIAWVELDSVHLNRM